MAISHTFILFFNAVWFCRSNSWELKHHLVHFLELTTQLIGDHLRSSPALYLGLLEYRTDLTIAARTKRATRFSLHATPIFLKVAENTCWSGKISVAVPVRTLTSPRLMGIIICLLIWGNAKMIPAVHRLFQHEDVMRCLFKLCEWLALSDCAGTAAETGVCFCSVSGLGRPR